MGLIFGMGGVLANDPCFLIPLSQEGPLEDELGETPLGKQLAPRHSRKTHDVGPSSVGSWYFGL